MNCIFWLIYLSLIFVVYSSTNKRKSGYVDGDIIIGALFSIHEKPTTEGNYTRTCGSIREQYGMHRVEALIKTINEINDNPEILPGIKLGVDIRDTCWYGPIALEQSLDFIRNSLSSQEPVQATKDMPGNQGYSGKAIASLIGAGESSVTIQVQNLLQLFKIPQISYAATSVDLSSKELYKYFLRVVPSDKLQAQALVDMIVHFKWEYVSLVNTQGQYGSKGINKLIEIIKNKEFCTDQMIEFEENEPLPKMIDKAKVLFDKASAKVIICFCQGDTVAKLFKTMIQLNKTNDGFLIVGTDGWADRTDILGDLIDRDTEERPLSRVARGGLSIRLQSTEIPGFKEYFQSKNKSNSPGNPWFEEFLEHTFKCKSRTCYGNESLYNEMYVEDSKLGFVVKSVMTVAHGLHNLYNKMCSKSNNKSVCSKNFHRNGTALLNEMMNVRFKGYDNEMVYFDSKGDPPGRYEIMNYQYQRDPTTGRIIFGYHRIGTWRNNILNIDGRVQWPGRSGDATLKSYCSPPCEVGWIREIVETKKCCWKCKRCVNNEYTKVNNSEEKCIGCKQGSIPNANRTGCVRLPYTFTQWSDASSIVAVIFSCVGIIASLAVMSIFIAHNNTPIVKSSTRELMYVILVGIIICYITTFPLLSKPTVFSCTLIRFMPGISFSLIFGALVTKTNRICRILATSKKKIVRNKGRFLTTQAQIVITAILNSIEIVIITVIVLLEPPEPKETFPSWNKLIIVCNNSDKTVLIPFGFDGLLVFFCTWYAIKTRNLPVNFNEAKYIGFTMYTTCIIWAAVVPIYFGADYRIISMTYAMNLSATTALILLFFPKVYIIIFKPEKNERSAFTTTTEIRCHIGPGYKNHSHSKEKYSEIHMDNRKCSQLSQNPTNTNCYSCNNNLSKIDSASPLPISSTDKAIQTETILILNCLSQDSGQIQSPSEDISLTQIALLHFLDENWDNNNSIPVTDMERVPQSRFTSADCDHTHSFDEADHRDEKISLVDPVCGCQANADKTYSPMSNISTDASSSTISAMFLEYLKINHRRFNKNKGNRSMKL